MHNIIHFYYQNKKKIWTVILITALIIGIIKFLNYMAGNKKPNNNKNQYKNSIEEINGQEPTNAIISNNSSLVDGEELSPHSLKTAKETINSFIDYCNNGEVENAYNVLTNECKEELYPTLDIFKNNYWKDFFREPKMCIIENWTNMTYKVTVIEDMITTGNNPDKNTYIDYMTIVSDGNVNKLNINNYIGRKEINKKTEKNNIIAKVISKDTYMDYEKYNIQIDNNSDKNVMLDNLEESDTIYLQDSKEVKYNSYNYKIQRNDMIINKGMKKNIEITFSNGYTPSRELKYLVFSRLISNNSDINNQETYAFYIEL